MRVVPTRRDRDDTEGDGRFLHDLDATGDVWRERTRVVTDVGPIDRSTDREHRSDVEDDEPVDHKPEVEEKCMPKCEKFVAAYEACAERIQGDETGEAHCTVSTNTKPRGRVASERVRQIERMNAYANERLTGVIS